MKKRDFQDLLSYLYAGFVVCVTFWIYVKTLAPTVSFFDSGELISAAYTLGVAHPPGYPLYVLLGWVFSKLLVGNVAYRLNLMSAFFAALAALMVYCLTFIILTQRTRNQCPSPLTLDPSPPADPERMLYPIVCMVAALTFAFSLTHWQQAVIAEVYTLNAFLCGLIILLLVKWRFSQHTRLLYLVALIFGLGFGNHQTIALLSLAACFLVLMTWPGILWQGKTLLRLLFFLLLGLSIYLLVPIRAAQNPPINWGNASTLRQFRWLVNREGYQNVPRGHALENLWKALCGNEPSADQNASEPQQESSDLNQNTGLARIISVVGRSLFLKQVKSFDPLGEFGYLGVFLAIVGLLYGLGVYRVITLTLLIAVVSLVIIVVIIGDAPEENIFLVKEFHTPAYLLAAVWIGMGAMALARAALWMASVNRKLQYAIVFLLALYFLVPPGSLMLKNLKTVDRRRNYVAYDYANNVLNSLQPHSILFTWGDSGAFPLWYLQIVEKKRVDVTLVHVPHLGARWYIETLPQDLFISADPHQQYEGILLPILDEIVQKHLLSRPLYFDFSSTHSLRLPYQLLPNGVTYKVMVSGDTLDENVWDRYSFRGILDNTRIAIDPDIRRTFVMYGSAHVELGNYYLQQNDVEKAAREFNLAVRFDPSLGDRIVRDLRFQDKFVSGSPNDASVNTDGPRISP